MDSGSDGNRQEEVQLCKSDNMENTNEPMEEEVPKILSPELQDVFPIFANMLDIKSFMKFAMTSKDMYQRCMEDKSIKINIDVDKLKAKKENDSVVYSCSLNDDYAATLRKLPCKFNVRSVKLVGITEASEVMAYLKENGVHRIQRLQIRSRCRAWEPVFAIIKDFGVKCVEMFDTIDIDILHSFLQLNVETFWYLEPIPVDFLLEIVTTIREIWFTGMREITKEELMLIMSKIQSGALPRLTLNILSIVWEDFTVLPFDYEGPLPEERPLFLRRRLYELAEYDDRIFSEYWFLHPNGEITKCDPTERIFFMEFYLIFRKCEPWEYPSILRKEEDVLKSLAEKRPEVLCSENQFLTFSKGLTMLDPSHKGPLPKDRPLYCKVSKYEFWLLDEDESLMKCTWKNDAATWNPFLTSESVYDKKEVNPLLAKHMFWKRLGQLEKSGNFAFYCEGPEEFDSWFDDFQKLDFEYSGPLSHERPLIFEIRDSEPIRSIRVVLLEDCLIECILKDNCIEIQRCSCSNRPPILFTEGNVVEMLKGLGSYVEKNFYMSLEVFHDGFKMFTMSRSFRGFIWEKTATNSEIEEYWYMMNEFVRKVVWKDRQVTLKLDEDLRESPPNFKKQVFGYFAENLPKRFCKAFGLELDQFNSCLEQFTVVPFDYSGPLKTDSPMAFVKNEIRHICRKGTGRTPRCNCTDFYILVWFLWKGVEVKYCSWRKGERINTFFGKCTYFKDVPPALKSNEYLKNLLEGKYDESSSYECFGSFDDFLAFFDGYVKLPFDYDGPLPEERPILFDDSADGFDPAYFILRKDETVIKCKKRASHISMFLSSKRALRLF